MKKFCITLILLSILFLTIIFGVCTNKQNNNEYLRIHIRANSNNQIDQDIKYQVRDTVVSYLTPYIASCPTKQQVVELLNEKSGAIVRLIDNKLKNSGYNYVSNIKICNELFPTRFYKDFVLEEGYYDAVIVELGEAKGDNWWCVIYPPLCFTDSPNLTYASKIIQIINDFNQKE